MLETRTVVEAQVCRIKTVHLSPVPSWREDLAKGDPIRAEYLLTVELQHGSQVLQAQYRIPTQVAEDGLSVTPLGIESGTPLIPQVDTIRKKAARPATVSGAVALDETGLPIIEDEIEGVDEIPTLAVLRFVPIHSGRGLKIGGGTFTPKFYTVPGGGMLPAQTAKNHGGVQVGWLDASEWELVEIPRQRAAGQGAVSLLATQGGKVPAFAVA
jgi:hypothetical protein